MSVDPVLTDGRCLGLVLGLVAIAVVRAPGCELFSLLGLLLTAIVYILRSSVPSHESFDAIRMLKRVHRGAYDENKPQSWYEKAKSRVLANVALAADVLTAEHFAVEFWKNPFHGCTLYATVTHESTAGTKTQHTWVGMLNKFYYVGQKGRDAVTLIDVVRRLAPAARRAGGEAS